MKTTDLTDMTVVTTANIITSRSTHYWLVQSRQPVEGAKWSSSDIDYASLESAEEHYEKMLVKHSGTGYEWRIVSVVKTVEIEEVRHSTTT